MLSVILCTHNPRSDYLERVLDALDRQTLEKNEWELLIIDNGSRIPLEGSLDVSWHKNAKVLRENRLGLTYARLRGIRESCGEALIFVDDDNALAEDYLTLAKEILLSHPFLGVIGGTCEGEFELPVPEWASWALGGLGVRKAGLNGTPVWARSPHPGPYTPIGAGMVARRVAADRYAELVETGSSLLTDRQGTSLSSGGDTEFALAANDIGLGQGTFPALKLTHLIAAERVQLDYLERLRYGLRYSGTMLRLRRGLMKPSVSRRPRWIRVWGSAYWKDRQSAERRKLIRAGINGELDAIRDYLLETDSLDSSRCVE